MVQQYDLYVKTRRSTLCSIVKQIIQQIRGGSVMYVSEDSYQKQYEQFQEWLLQCPLKVTNYTDNYTDFAIDFCMEVD